jgi:thioredoxin reductase (NADPH)
VRAEPDDTLDWIVIGGGPAGLSAAIYLARFHLSGVVIDDDRSRAALIPLTRNLAGFPDGIAGQALLSRMRRQADSFGTRIISGHADSLVAEGSSFRVGVDVMQLRASKVLLATGVLNLRPRMPDMLHDEAVARGLLRYCPVCDGFEVTDRRVALLGTGPHALREAEFLRSYTADVTLIAPHGAHAYSPEQWGELRHWNIAVEDGPVTAFRLAAGGISLQAGGRAFSFDTLYAALGTEVRSELARHAGADTSADGSVLVDRHQMTSIEGLYAAGDVVKGLDQIGNAMGQAGIAATAMRNALCQERPLRRAGLNHPERPRHPYPLA